MLTLLASLYEWIRDDVGFDEILPAAVINFALWPLVVPVVLTYRLFDRSRKGFDMKTLVIIVLLGVAVYPWLGPALGLEIPLLNSFFTAAYEALNG